jgi:hypothetical protein
VRGALALSTESKRAKDGAAALNDLDFYIIEIESRREQLVI